MSKSISFRLQKVIADCGITSRRKAEELILQGRVKVNHEVVTVLGTKVNPYKDLIQVDEKVIDIMATQKLYVVLNKPRGYITTLHDPEGRKTVLDLCGGIDARIYPVGRLDYLSEGLLVLTNDGDMAHKIMHPSFEVTKIYEVKVFGSVSEGLLKNLRKGIKAHDGELKPQSVRIIKQLPNKTWIEFRLNEGKNREIRRICEAVGLTIDKLRRVAIEGLSIDAIAPGNFRFVTKKDLLSLLNFNENGNRSSKTVTYRSAKRTIKLGKKRSLRPS